MISIARSCKDRIDCGSDHLSLVVAEKEIGQVWGKNRQRVWVRPAEVHQLQGQESTNRRILFYKASGEDHLVVLSVSPGSFRERPVPANLEELPGLQLLPMLFLQTIFPVYLQAAASSPTVFPPKGALATYIFKYILLRSE